MFNFEEANEAIKKNEIMNIQAGGMTVGQATQFLSKKLDLTPLISRASCHVIESEESASQALSMSLQARKIRKQLDETRLSIVRPHLDFQKAINKIVKEYEAKLEEIENNLKSKLDEYLQKSASTNNASFIAKSQEMFVEDGKLTKVKKWVWELENEAQVPREYLSLDSKKVDEAVKQGVRNIPGIKVFEKEEISMRIKN
jgi:exonuclease VII large subunit